MTFTQLAEQMQRSMEILEEINNPKPKVSKKTTVQVGGLIITVVEIGHD